MKEFRMEGRGVLLLWCLLFGWFQFSFGQNEKKTNPRTTSDLASEERVSELLTRPACLENLSNWDSSCTVEEVIISSGNIKLHGALYLPSYPGPHPAVVIMHGGGNNHEVLMNSPRYHAPGLANCGYAALIYDKRGTGKSGGVFHESTYDDYVSDAGHAADFLMKHEQIDSNRIGVYGGSQGGRLAPIVAIRFPGVAFAISASGPIGTIAEQSDFNMEYALEIRGYDDSTIEQVMPLWRRHHRAWSSLNPDDLQAVADEIVKMRKYIDPMALPNTRQEFLTDSNLFFLKPVYNSMSLNYVDELVNLNVPWLVLYGELDPIVDVRASVKNIQDRLATSHNEDYEIIVFRNVGHSFDNRETGEYVSTIRVMINWLNEISPKMESVEESDK